MCNNVRDPRRGSQPLRGWSSHEVGHLFGALHDVYQDVNYDNIGPTGYAHGHKFSIKYCCRYFLFWCTKHCTTYYRTVMAYGNELRVPFYSNPNVGIFNPAYPSIGRTGVANVADNARKISNTRQLIEDYFDETIAFSASLSVDGPAPCEEEGSADVVVTCGTAPYTYAWYRSNNGINYSLISGATSSSITYPIFGMGHRFIKVIVTDATNATVTRIGSYNIPHCCPTCPVRKQTPNSKPEYDISISPNPNDGNFSLNIQSDVKDIFSYEIYNSIGQQVMNVTKANLNIGQNNFNINMSKFNEGYYLIKIKTSSSSQSIPFSKSK